MRVRSRKKDVRKEVTYKGLDCSKRSASKPVQNSREINGTIVAEEVWVASRRVASRRVAWTTAFITQPVLVEIKTPMKDRIIKLETFTQISTTEKG